ncbi:MAG: SulP family inorganic anion transporter [Rhodoferax sp.]
MAPHPESLTDDAWGGLGAMLVALPSAIAFGVATYGVLGPAHAAQGAVAGMLGATILVLVASAWGGAPRLITAPCAPAVAVLSAFALDHAARGAPAAHILLLLLITGLLAGAVQVGFGLAGLGRLIKYMPYPVVSGYLSAVGLTIILSQIARLLGAPPSTSWHLALTAPALWDWRAMTIAITTIVAMLVAPRWTRKVPAPILALLAGALAYLVLALGHPALWRLESNPLVVGPVAGAGAFAESFTQRGMALIRLEFSDLAGLLVPALTLAVLLSIDTLKTCVVLDAMTRSRHDSNRTLIGQGMGNMASALVGGMAGAGTMGATLVNLSSGGRTRRSGLFAGLFALLAFVALGAVLAWLPVAALAGLLVVVGLRMLDRESLHFLASRQTILDFAVIATVVLVALSVGLIAASGAGILLAIGLFLREQVAGTVVVRRQMGSERHSKRVRTTAERSILEAQGGQSAIFELQGSLFFGTTDQLFGALEPDLALRRYIVLDLRRVQSVDLTAVHMLRQVEDRLAERGAGLLFSAVPETSPSGRDIRRYFQTVGLVDASRTPRIFDDVDDALEWIEDGWIAQASIPQDGEAALELRDMDLFAGRRAQTLADLQASMETRSLRSGEPVFRRGDGGDEIYLIRRGVVRIQWPLDTGHSRHLASFGRGSFFGEMAFLDHQPRSADAVAFTDCELFVLSRQRYDTLVAHHKLLGLNLMEGLARLLASRLRHTDAELRALQTS